jgi:hypothetical protein
LPRLLPADELEGSSLTKAHELRPRSRISPLAVARVGSPVAWTITSAVNAANANQRKKNNTQLSNAKQTHRQHEFKFELDLNLNVVKFWWIMRRTVAIPSDPRRRFAVHFE